MTLQVFIISEKSVLESFPIKYHKSKSIKKYSCLSVCMGDWFRTHTKYQKSVEAELQQFGPMSPMDMNGKTSVSTGSAS